MKRREILRYTAYATGAAIGAPLIASILSGCQDVNITTGSDKLEFFNNSEFELVKTLIDTILPKTDSPSATDVGVHKMIDHMVHVVYDKKSKDEYRNKFTALQSYLNSKTGQNFMDLKGEKQVELVKSLGLASDPNVANAKSGLTDLKQQTIAYYLSSEEIGTNYLNYLPVPGEYQGCISLEEAGGKAWAL